MNCYVMLFLHRRACKKVRQHGTAVRQDGEAGTPLYPRVTVQLPIYNERYVIQRLVEAVVRLCYPRALWEIQILDDSTDETTAMAIQLVERYRHLGFNITLLYWLHRHGYKAGALSEGLMQATGEFIAIFDADFVRHSSTALVSRRQGGAQFFSLKVVLRRTLYTVSQSERCDWPLVLSSVDHVCLGTQERGSP
jgi:cellulose synthase/poly-beta-1,6-N-acetylglucosamine synthase-like glycosyltransferase